MKQVEKLIAQFIQKQWEASEEDRKLRQEILYLKLNDKIQEEQTDNQNKKVS